MKKLNLNFIDNGHNNNSKSMSSSNFVRHDRIFDLQKQKQKQRNKSKNKNMIAVGNQSLKFGTQNMHVLSYNQNLEIFNDQIDQQQYQQQQSQQQQQQYEYDDHNNHNKKTILNNKQKNKNNSETEDENKHCKDIKKNKEIKSKKQT